MSKINLITLSSGDPLVEQVFLIEMLALKKIFRVELNEIIQ